MTISFLKSKSRRLLNAALLTGLLALASVMAASSYSTVRATAAPAPQATITGEWTADFQRDKEEKISLRMQRRDEMGRMGNSGSDFSLSEFQGLTREQAFGPKTDVRFRLVREAGTFELVGTFGGGHGNGTWTLTPSRTFVSEMRARGYDNLPDEKLYVSALIDIHVKTIDDLKAAGFDHLSFDDVIKATIFKVTPEYISEMKSLGFENLGLEDYVKGRIFKVDAEFAREVKEMGFGRETLESLVKMRIFKVTPDFLREMKAAGLENLSIEDLVKLRIFKIDSDFIQRARSSGYAATDVEELVRLRIHERIK